MNIESKVQYVRLSIVIVATVVVTVFANPLPALGQSSTFEQPPIDYLNAPVNDPVAQLADRIASGATQLEFDDKQGYLLSVLKELAIPVSSQTLVFSKTSLQLQRISPRRPRALYFNDDVYVGFCQNGDVLEFAATDPMQGAIFYTLDQSKSDSPEFVRDRGSCLTCHASSRTQNIPGYLVRSVFADGSGYPILGSGTYNTDHTSPMTERWGGWYVTGTHGKTKHMGNVLYNKDDIRGNRELSGEGSNLTSLDSLVSTAAYPSSHSDLVALMVLEHQTQMHNAIAAANYETRQALHQSFQMNEILERGEGHVSESAQRRIDAVAENVVRHLLMSGEIVLSEPIAGTSGFAEEFAARGKRDSKGRSLRELDLQDRLFKYRCSYLIDSPAFDALPDHVRTRIYDRLVDVLVGDEASKDFQHVSSNDRAELVEILKELKPEFAARL
ncbi:MAG TPA: hypothetical protein DDZ51_28215 [Planctomycetaceae bacterium]|nr:hypothetical protein [Planctomycetaceae bacterium]